MKRIKNKKDLEKELKKLKEEQKKYQKEWGEKFKEYFIHSQPMNISKHSRLKLEKISEKIIKIERKIKK